jgi:thiol-disulfide isomerase/thioredoxin
VPETPPPKRQRQRQFSPYTAFVGIAFIALVAVAGINTLRNTDNGIAGTDSGAGDALAEFAVADARSDLEGDANIAQDDCKSSTRPCPAGDVRTPACQVDDPGAFRVCDFFDKPLVISFWFTKGGDCESDQDVFEAAYRQYKGSVNFLGVNVRDSRSKVRDLIASHGWTHPIGLDSDGALSNLYRVGGCPTFFYVYPGGIVQNTGIGNDGVENLDADVQALRAASAERAAAEE